MENTSQLTSIPNLITFGRIIAVPVVCWLIIFDNIWLRGIALVLFIVAAASDWVDGYLARRWGQSSPLGKMLDPIADKLLVGALIVTLAWDRSFSAWDLIPAIAILLREIFVAGLREYLGNASVSVPVTQLAKWKTTVQLVALGFIIFERMVPAVGLVSDLLLWVAGLLTVWTGYHYLYKAWPHLDSPNP
jgi:cardiolipin synthase (CMP-forming)